MNTSTAIHVSTINATVLILTGRSNSRRWYNSYIVILRGARYWYLVNDGVDKETRPVHLKGENNEDFTKQLEKYDERNNAAHASLLAGVSEDLQDIVSACVLNSESARVAMRLL